MWRSWVGREGRWRWNLELEEESGRASEVHRPIEIRLLFSTNHFVTLTTMQKSSIIVRDVGHFYS